MYNEIRISSHFSKIREFKVSSEKNRKKVHGSCSYQFYSNSTDFRVRYSPSLQGNVELKMILLTDWI